MSLITIPNYNVLIQEFTRVRENALPEFWFFEVEILSTYALVNELITDLWAIDKLVEAIDFNQAIEIGRRFELLADRLFSIPPHFKQAFTTKDKALSWRGSMTNNIVQLVEKEVRIYVDYFRPCCSEDPVEDRNLWPEEEDALQLLRTLIRMRVAKDDNGETAKSTLSGQSRNKVPQPPEVSEFYRLQKLTTWQGKSKAEIHREIARRIAKKTKRTLNKAQLMTEAERIKKAIRDYERKVTQQQ